MDWGKYFILMAAVIGSWTLTAWGMVYFAKNGRKGRWMIWATIPVFLYAIYCIAGSFYYYSWWAGLILLFISAIVYNIIKRSGKAPIWLAVMGAGLTVASAFFVFS